MGRIVRVALGIGLGIGMLGLAACSMTPVPAHMRGDLARPTMTAEELTIGLDGHVRAVSEGASGTLGGGGGGCGCN